MRMRFKSGFVMFLFSSITALFILSLFVFIEENYGVPIAYFTRDVAQLLDEAFYIGLISNIGLLLWCACGTASVFGYLLLKGKDREKSHYLLYAGIISFVLLSDDLMLLHERVLPIHLGIPSYMIYLTYALVTLLFIIRYIKVILKADCIGLSMAILFLSISAGIDFLHDAFAIEIPRRFLVEDGAKFIGIVQWTTHFSGMSYQWVRIQ